LYKKVCSLGWLGQHQLKITLTTQKQDLCCLAASKPTIKQTKHQKPGCCFPKTTIAEQLLII
jgi:hypothetical protein